MDIIRRSTVLSPYFDLYRLLLTCLFLSVFVYLPVDNLAYFVVPTLLVLISIYYLASGNTVFRIHWVDVGMVGFVIWAFFSGTWARDVWRVWYAAFTYLNILLFLAILRNTLFHQRDILKKVHQFLCLLFLVSLAHHILALHLEVSPDKSWNAFLIKNKNYTTTYLIALLPFLIFYPFSSRLLQYIKFISLVLCFNIVLITHSRGGLLGLSVIVMVFVAMSPRFEKRRGLAYVLLGVLTASGFYLFNFSAHDSYPAIATYREELASRWYMICRSFELFISHPVKGVGLAQWPIFAYAEGLPNVAPYNQSHELFFLRSHNQFAKLLAEIGIIGLMAYGMPIFYALVLSIKAIKQLSGIELAALSSFGVYLVGSYFYCTVNAHEYLFSNVQYLGWFSWGLLVYRLSRGDVKMGRHFILLIVGLAMTATIYFGKIYLNIHKYWHAQKLVQAGKDIDAITALEGIYHPVWYASYDFENSIAHQLGNLYAAQNNLVKANNYYKKATELSPHDIKIFVDYADFLIKNQVDQEKLDEMIKKLEALPNDYNPVLIVLAAYYHANGQTEKMERYLNRIKSPDEAHKVK